MADRRWSREALDAEDPATSLRLHARNSRLICERVADLQRRTSMRSFVRQLARKTDLRQDVRTITETMWAMIPGIYLRLVRDAGRPPDRFETWLGDTFIRLWLP